MNDIEIIRLCYDLGQHIMRFIVLENSGDEYELEGEINSILGILDELYYIDVDIDNFGQNTLMDIFTELITKYGSRCGNTMMASMILHGCKSMLAQSVIEAILDGESYELIYSEENIDELLDDVDDFSNNELIKYIDEEYRIRDLVKEIILEEMDDDDAFNAVYEFVTENTYSCFLEIEDGVLTHYFGYENFVVIPPIVTEIGEHAFHCAKSITEVEIPYSVEIIGRCAFNGCTNLTNINLPFGVTEIGESAFEDCSSLEEFEIPPLVQEIAERTFYGCTSLSSVSIPSSVTCIGTYAFGKCESLDEVDIPDSVELIGDYAFSDCPNTTLILPEHFNDVDEEDIGDLYEIIIRGSDREDDDHDSESDDEDESTDSLYSLLEEFNLVDPLRKILETIDDSEELDEAEEIEEPECHDDDELTEEEEVVDEQEYNTSDFDIQNGVLIKYVGNGGDVIIPNGVRGIGDKAFYLCESLTSVTIPESVESIGWCAFAGCESLTNITILSHSIDVDTAAFMLCSEAVVTMPESFLKISKVFGDCKSIKYV